MSDTERKDFWHKVTIVSGFLTAVTGFGVALQQYLASSSPSTPQLPTYHSPIVPVRPAPAPDAPPQPPPTPAPVRKPPMALANNTYDAVRGYDGEMSRSQPNICPRSEVLRVTVHGDTITFVTSEEDARGPLSRDWTGDIDQVTGEITISGSKATPRTNRSLTISGPYGNATMNSGYCGSGYFKIKR